jgi:type IV fimbrial biogenesis protein FimT
MQRIACRHHFSNAQGLTLLELMISLVVLATILTLGVLAFSSLAARSQQTAEINRFVRSLQLTRSYAIKSGYDHVLCPSNDFINCLEGTTWERGYLLFEDRNADRLRNPGEKLLHVTQPAGKIGIAMHSTSGRQLVIYRPDGRSDGSNLTLTFCDPERQIPPKAVILSNTGHARVSTSHWDGSPLICDP